MAIRFLVDTNVLIALTNTQHIHHQRAHAWFTTVTSWATTAITETAFVRLMLNPHVAGRQLRLADVLFVLAQLRDLPGHHFLVDDSSLIDASIDLVGLVGHQQVTDLHLVNLAARHQCILATLDTAISNALINRDKTHVQVI